MIVDIVIVAIIILFTIVGYFQGFLKRFYNILGVVLATSFAFILKNVIITIIIGFIDIEPSIKEIIENIGTDILSIVSFTVLLIFLTIIFKIIIFILIKTGVLSIDKTKLRPLGALLSLIITLFYLNILVFFLSLTTLIEGVVVYTDSFLAPKILDLNPYTNNISHNIKDLYYDAVELVDITSSLEDFESFDEQGIEVLGDILANDLITDEMIVDTVTTFIESAEVDLSEVEISEDIDWDLVKEEFSKTPIYTELKSWYDEEVLTEDLIKNLIEETNIDVDYNDIIDLFKN